MAWIPGALAGVGSIASAVQGRKESKEQRAMMAEQAATLRYQRELGKNQWARYEGTFAPVEDEAAAMARTIAIPEYAAVDRRATGDYTRARNQTRSEAQRTYSRMGVDPSNPMYMRGINRTAISDALALSTARNMAREAERNRTRTQGFDARMSVSNLGRGLAGGALSALSSAGTGFGQAGQVWGQQAAGSWGAAGYLAGTAYDRLRGVNWGGGSSALPVSNNYSYTSGGGFTPGAAPALPSNLSVEPAAWTP